MATLTKKNVKKPSYLKEVAGFHIDSMNFVLREGLKSALLDIDPVHTSTKNNVKISISEVILNPVSYPMDTRTNKRFVYPSESDLCCLNGLTDSELIKLKEDPNDPGGYFIINGSERIIRMFGKPRRNYPLALINKRWKLMGKGYSEYAVFVSCIKGNHSLSDMYLHYVNATKDTDHPFVEVRVFYYGKPYFIPLVLLLKSLVDENDYSIIREIAKFNDDTSLKLLLKNMFHDIRRIGSSNSNSEVPVCICTHLQAKLFIGKLFYPVFKGSPNATYCDVTDHFLHFCISKLFALARKKCNSDDLDNPAFHEVLTPGEIYLLAVKYGVNCFLNSVKNSLRKKIEDMILTSKKKVSEKDIGSSLKDMVKSCTYKAVSLTPIVKTIIATGNLPGNHCLASSTGFTVSLGRTNVFEVASHFNGIYKFSMNFYAKNMRKYYPESWGFLCPAHTPEGENIGLYNHLSLGCKIVSLNSSTLQWKLLYKFGVLQFYDPLTYSSFDKHLVFVDGRMIGWISQNSIPSFLNKLKFLRSVDNSSIPEYTEIVLVSEEQHNLYPGIYIFSTPCRFVRQIKNNQSMNYELIGTFEQLTIQVHLFSENSSNYSEISDYNFLGMAAAAIPFGENNPATRNIHSTCKSNQAVSFPLTNSKWRSDSKSMFLTYPQVPIVTTSEYEKYNWDENPNGFNISIAVISYSGFDMEDAVVINKSSVDRGLLRDVMYKTVTYDFAELAANFECKVTELVFKRNPNESNLSNYLDAGGTPYVGQRVEKDSPILSVYSTKTKEYVVKTYQNRRPAYIDAVKFMGISPSFVEKKLPSEIQRIAITYCTKRIPVVGDKFSNRHSQKGICAAILPPEDLPFSNDGLVPDILFNPHGIPSRMTVGMLLEILASVAGISLGKRQLVSPFEFTNKNTAAEYYGNILKNVGLDFYGTQKFYSGTSGEELEADIFCGNVYYFRLKHVVEEKYQVASVVEDLDPKTMQPLNIDLAGAIRFGEMERDALLSHGAMNLLLDRLLHNSDSIKAYICENCQQILFPVTHPPNLEFNFQRIHKNNNCCMCQKISTNGVRIPYVLVYLVSELAAVNIKFQFSLE